MSKHIKTDPACIEFREPRTRIGQWKYDRARGRACMVCADARRTALHAAQQHVDIMREYREDTRRAIERMEGK